MKFTGERSAPESRGQIAYERRHRYAVCLDFARDRDVLDVACGEGYGSSLLAPVARSVIGMDIDEAAIRDAASRYVGTNLTYRTGSATALPLADESVDLVVSFETVEHVAEQRDMIRELARVLRGDGRLLISAPNKLIFSDARACSNEFHVRELYFDEFRALLCEFFPRVRLFGQRMIGSSAIHPLQGASSASNGLGSSGRATSGIVALPEPEYFLALCAKDTAGDLADLTSVYLDPTDDLLLDLRGRDRGASNGHAENVVCTESSEREALVARVAELTRACLDLERDRERVVAHIVRADGELETTRAELAATAKSFAELGLLLEERSTALAALEAERNALAARLAELEEGARAGRLAEGEVARAREAIAAGMKLRDEAANLQESMVDREFELVRQRRELEAEREALENNRAEAETAAGELQRSLEARAIELMEIQRETEAERDALARQRSEAETALEEVRVSLAARAVELLEIERETDVERDALVRQRSDAESSLEEVRVSLAARAAELSDIQRETELEREALVTRQAEIDAERAALVQRLDEAEAERAALVQRLDEAEAERAALAQRLDESETSVEHLWESIAERELELAEELQETEAERDALAARLAAAEASLESLWESIVEREGELVALQRAAESERDSLALLLTEAEAAAIAREAAFAEELAEHAKPDPTLTQKLATLESELERVRGAHRATVELFKRHVEGDVNAVRTELAQIDGMIRVVQRSWAWSVKMLLVRVAGRLPGGRARV